MWASDNDFGVSIIHFTVSGEVIQFLGGGLFNVTDRTDFGQWETPVCGNVFLFR